MKKKFIKCKAVAGAGKTTYLVSLLDKNEKALFL